MDFIVGLPRTTKGFDSIWVIIDRLTKIAHFLPIKTDHPVVVYAQLYITRILSLHGVPKTIVLDHGPQFISVGTLNQGYLLLQYEDAVPIRRSLAAR
jgi:hypothetical protein